MEMILGGLVLIKPEAFIAIHIQRDSCCILGFLASDSSCCKIPWIGGPFIFRKGCIYLFKLFFGKIDFSPYSNVQTFGEGKRN